VKLVLFSEWAENVGVPCSPTVLFHSRAVRVVWKYYYPHLSCFHARAREWATEEWNWFQPWPWVSRSALPLVKDQKKAVSTSSYNRLAAIHNAKISFWETDGLSTTGTSFMSWMFLRILTSHTRTHAEKLMKTSRHVQESLRAGVHVLTVTAGRCACLNSHCGPGCMFKSLWGQVCMFKQSLRAGVHVLTVTEGRCPCFNSQWGQVSMF
jgi:hypothetical protein